MTTAMEDDIPELPSDTLAILEEFLKEKEKREQQEETGGKDIDFEENWQLSQFWYSTKTKSDLTKVCQHLATNKNYQIGLLSCPSLYTSIKAVHSLVKIFEYDRRFSSYGDDFHYYDFNEADDANCLADFVKYFDLVIVDPPFLSEECMDKMAKIVRKCIKDDGKILFCSGAICEPWIRKFLELKKCQYRPEHERNLGNEFVSYANFDLDEILSRILDDS